MKRIAWVLLVAGASLWADSETALVEKLYAKLAASFSSGQALGIGGDYLLLANPGFPVSKQDWSDGYQISMLADQIPLPARTYLPSPGFYSDTYGTILDHSETSHFQNMADKEKLRTARRVVFDKNRPGTPTPAYAAYLKHKAAWLAAQDALNQAQVEHQVTGRAVPQGLDLALAAAMKAWENQGSKKEIESAFATMDTIYGENVGALFTDIRDAYTLGRTDDGHDTVWYPVTANPPPETWMDDKDWKPFSLTQTEKSLARGTASLPLGAKAAKAPDDLAGSVSITMETKRVTLARPWLDMGIFTNHRWRLQASSGFKMVSTGNPSDPDPGLMPLMVTGVLLSRKLVLKGQWKTTTVTALGPFNLSGKPTPKGDQMSLTVDGAQIIGFFCTTVPKSPDPDDKAFRTSSRPEPQGPANRTHAAPAPPTPPSRTQKPLSPN